jgi:hypothetical protein
MSEIRIKIPDGIPVNHLKRKIDELVREEEIKWLVFSKCKEELSLDKKELIQLEKDREDAWIEIKKKYDL